MPSIKGFSLIEVLLSLLLITSVALGLLEQQSQSKQLLNRIIVSVEASQFLDKMNEQLLVKVKTQSRAPLRVGTMTRDLFKLGQFK